MNHFVRFVKLYPDMYQLSEEKRELHSNKRDQHYVQNVVRVIYATIIVQQPQVQHLLQQQQFFMVNVKKKIKLCTALKCCLPSDSSSLKSNFGV